MSSFNKILRRLLEENMHGPTSIDDTSDLDVKDPRWFELFLSLFITDSCIEHDDLLFFVRADFTADTLADSPIFVRRNTGKELPILSHIVCWKRTLFLNMIVQTPSVLTVAVCRKKDSILDLNNQHATSNRTNMIASTRIIKQVYASPYKTRMDVKDTITNACSFPLIHYTVNDFTSQHLHITVRSDEYLCVELSILTAPDIIQPVNHNFPNINLEPDQKLNIDTTLPPQPYPESSSPIEKLSAITIDENTSPFPTPFSHDKIVLFKGAVHFNALLEVVMQKSLGLKGYQGWFKGNVEEREFILMRGPDGKGQCQVSIQHCVDDDGVGGFKQLRKTLLNQMQPTTELECSMTYVNVSWQSIIMYKRYISH